MRISWLAIRGNLIASCVSSALLVSSVGSTAALAQATTLLNERGTLQSGDEVAPDDSLYDSHAFEWQAVQGVAVASSETVLSQGAFVVAEARPGFELYEYQNLFSIEYPEDWYVEDYSASALNIIIWSQRPPEGFDWPSDLVKTDIYFLTGDFDTALQQFLVGIETGDGVVTRQGELTVGGRRAMRIWSSSNDWLPSISTLVQYDSDRTALISSFYIDDSYIDEIQDIHWSFRKLN